MAIRLRAGTEACTRLGRQETVLDAAGTRVFTYNTGMQLESEAITAGQNGLYTKTITRSYENGSTGTVAGRAAALYIGTEYLTGYHYDDSGRLDRITGPGLGDGRVEYTRAADSELVEYVRYKSGSGATLAQTRRKHGQTGDNRALLHFVENQAGSPLATVSRYTYTNDDLGRRTSVVLSGSAFTAGDGEHHWQWGYNTRNELTAAHRCEGTDPSGACSPLLIGYPSQLEYSYDPIGNRKTYTTDFGEITYTTNNVNQYTWWSSPYGNFNLTYDADGNLASGLWLTYLWDGENRLKAVYPMSPFVNDVKVEFDYDYRSRRVRKRVFTWTGSAWATTPTKDERFVYDEWNPGHAAQAKGASFAEGKPRIRRSTVFRRVRPFLNECSLCLACSGVGNCS